MKSFESTGYVFTNEIDILDRMTAAGLQHVVVLPCAITQNGQAHLILSPWCEFNLHDFLHLTPIFQRSTFYKRWSLMTKRERLVSLLFCMSCLAAGLASLHKLNVKQLNTKLKNVMLSDTDGVRYPYLCGFGFS
jgi:DNA-binding CsgD family transcriptional regulator